jgi:hypothetical protein
MALRRIDQEATLDEVRSEVWFTVAALEADPDAADLVALTENWEAKVDAAETLQRAFLRAEARTDARRVGANGRLDAACVSFGDELFYAVGKDRKSPRWLSFFRVAVSRFVRRGLSDQVAAVGGWLGTTGDSVLESHREDLTRTQAEARVALDATAALAPQRGALWQARATLAEELTAARDGLHEALAARARERALPRDWPSLFFRPSRRASGDPGDTAVAPPDTLAPQAEA